MSPFHFALEPTEHTDQVATFKLMMCDCQWVVLWYSRWTDQSMSYVLCNHVSWLMVCRYGAQVRWSTAKVKVMRVRADGPRETKDKRWT
jgi:hypothetical protein